MKITGKNSTENLRAKGAEANRTCFRKQQMRFVPLLKNVWAVQEKDGVLGVTGRDVYKMPIGLRSIQNINKLKPFVRSSVWSEQ